MDVFKVRCGCGNIHGRRESCARCAERKRGAPVAPPVLRTSGLAYAPPQFIPLAPPPPTQPAPPMRTEPLPGDRVVCLDGCCIGTVTEYTAALDIAKVTWLVGPRPGDSFEYDSSEIFGLPPDVTRDELQEWTRNGLTLAADIDRLKRDKVNFT